MDTERNTGWRSFDRVAAIYEGAERLLFGPRLQAARTAGLNAVSAPRRALLLGEGDGRFAEVLLERFAECEVEIVDRSAKMLELAQRRLSRFGKRALYRRADLLESTWPGPFDLVTTLFVLDCFDAADQRRVIERVAPASSADATWLYADFDPGPQGLRGGLHKLTLWSLYAGFGALTDIGTLRYHDPLPLFAEHGFHTSAVHRVGLLRHAALRRCAT